MSMNKVGTPKPRSISDDLGVNYVMQLIMDYHKVIPLLDNDVNQEIRDIGIDLRDNLKNLKRIRDKIEAITIADALDGTQKALTIIDFHIDEMDKVFKEYNIT